MQAIVFLTHMESEPIYQHFLRLKAETQGILDVYLALHEPSDGRSGISLPVDFLIPATGLWQNIFTVRYAEKKVRGGTFVPGFTDLIYIPILLGPQLADYSHIWFIEFDVDFAGPWNEF